MSLEDKVYSLLPFYKRSPDWFKAVISYPIRIIPRPVLLGKNYRYYYNQAKAFQYASEQTILEYQFAKLTELLDYCYTWVPYYNKHWNEHGVDISKIKDFNDFKKQIPFTSRLDIQIFNDEFKSKYYKTSKGLKVNSGGSTGEPLTLYYLKGFSRSAEWAHMHLLWEQAGYKPGMILARLRGDYIGKSKYFTFDPWRNYLLLSSSSLNEHNTKEYLNLLIKYKVQFINAYPASLYNLIQLSGLNSFNIPTLKGILLGSENIYPWQIAKIKDFFNIKNLLYWYGHAEICALAGNCNESGDYHFFPTYGYTEFEDLEDTEEIKEIVATSFINHYMPLIRYKTQDHVKPASPQCACGKKFLKASQIIGREQEIAIGMNGEKITLTALIFGRHKNYFNHVIKMQIINTSKGNLHVKVIPKSTFTNKHRKQIINSLSVVQNAPFNTTCEEVKVIPTSKRGKHIFFIRKF